MNFTPLGALNQIKINREGEELWLASKQSGLVGRQDMFFPRELMCPLVQWVKVHAQWRFGVEALTGARALTHCIGGHISFLRQGDLVSPTSIPQKSK